jgi:hypothetical protein
MEALPEPTAQPKFSPMPPILPIKREWRAAVLEAAGVPDTAPINPVEPG